MDPTRRPLHAAEHLRIAEEGQSAEKVPGRLTLARAVDLALYVAGDEAVDVVLEEGVDLGVAHLFIMTTRRASLTLGGGRVGIERPSSRKMEELDHTHTHELLEALGEQLAARGAHAELVSSAARRC
jgi:hypothetical protein